MNQDKRHDSEPIPSNLEDWLTQDQLMALKHVESFGWQLKFVRRPAFQDPIVVLFSADNKKIGVMGKDGKIDMNPDIQIRE
jgi:hypothetical protein